MELAGGDQHNRLVVSTQPDTELLWFEMIDANKRPQQMQVQLSPRRICLASRPPSNADSMGDRDGRPQTFEPGTSSTPLASHSLTDRNGKCSVMSAQPGLHSLTDIKHSNGCPLIFELDFGEDKDAAPDMVGAPAAKLLISSSRDAPNPSSSACHNNSQPQELSHNMAPRALSVSSKPAADICSLVFPDESQEDAVHHAKHYEPIIPLRHPQQHPSPHLQQHDSSNMTAHHTTSPTAHRMMLNTGSSGKAIPSTADRNQQSADHSAVSPTLGQDTSAAHAAAFLPSHVEEDKGVHAADDDNDENSCTMIFDEEMLPHAGHTTDVTAYARPCNNAAAAAMCSAFTQDVTTQVQRAALAVTPVDTQQHADQAPGSMTETQTHHSQTIKQRMPGMHNSNDQSLLQSSTMLQDNIPCSPDDVVCSMVFCDEEDQYNPMMMQKCT